MRQGSYHWGVGEDKKLEDNKEYWRLLSIPSSFVLGEN